MRGCCRSIYRYDAFSSILGEGKPFVGIDNSYLQSGHTVLLALVLVCAFIDLPGFPLTSLPYDVREFLKVRALLHLPNRRTFSSCCGVSRLAPT